jgi:hypothetical protein
MFDSLTLLGPPLDFNPISGLGLFSGPIATTSAGYDSVEPVVIVGFDPSNGTVSVDSTGTITYTDTSGGFSSNVIFFRVRDSNGDLSNVGDVQVSPAG